MESNRVGGETRKNKRRAIAKWRDDFARKRCRHRKPCWKITWPESRHIVEPRLGRAGESQFECGGTACCHDRYAADSEKRLADCVAAARDYLYGFDHAFWRRHERTR